MKNYLVTEKKGKDLVKGDMIYWKDGWFKISKSTIRHFNYMLKDEIFLAQRDTRKLYSDIVNENNIVKYISKLYNISIKKASLNLEAPFGHTQGIRKGIIFGAYEFFKEFQ